MTFDLDRDGELLVGEAGAERVSRNELAAGGVEEVATGLELGLLPIAGGPPACLLSG